jgi:glycosyltransferase involved in cell wall biosynthesis
MIISHVANQVEYNGRKGHKELIEAAAILKQQNINVEVRFAGKDYFGGQEKLTEFARKKEVADRVKFLGYVDRCALDNFLSDSDLFVLPTRAEGLPSVIIEAMAKGLPCISTNVSGNPELLDSHWLINYEDVLTLAERIKELCTNVELYNEVSITNFKKSGNYEASILEKRRDEFYKKLRELVK